MASPHTTSHPAFLVFPNLSREYTWRVIAVETGRTISRHKNLALAYEKAELLNLRSASLDSPMPDPVFGTVSNWVASDERGSCQSWFAAADSAIGEPCSNSASLSDLDTGLAHCVQCYRVNAL